MLFVKYLSLNKAMVLKCYDTVLTFQIQVRSHFNWLELILFAQASLNILDPQDRGRKVGNASLLLKQPYYGLLLSHLLWDLLQIYKINYSIYYICLCF